MENINSAFFFVVDKIVDLMGFFIGKAMGIGYVVLLIAILSAALNYALTGQGLKENIVKILKATVFFFVIIFAYPRIIGFITSWTFNMARDSIYPSVQRYYEANKGDIANLFNEEIVTYRTVNTNNGRISGNSAGRGYVTRKFKEKVAGDPDAYFSDLIRENRHPQMTYYAVPPASLAKIILAIARSCLDYADKKKFGIPEFSTVLKGLICAFFIILTGAFAILEYLIAFLEFMLVASVGIILFPLSLWEGSKFMSEKFIGAILGFFIKLLFCNIAIFLMIYGFITMAHQFASNPFGGLVEQIISIIFLCLLFFFICKSAPALAQSLLTGTPSLSATGAISAVGGAVAAAGATMGMAKAAGGKLAGGVAKTGAGIGGSLMEAAAASNAVKDAGGTGSQRFGAFMSSLRSDAGDSLKAKGLGLARSLMGSSSGGGSSGGGGMNPHSWRDTFLQEKGKEGGNMTIGEVAAQRKEEGAKRGKEYMNKHP